MKGPILLLITAIIWGNGFVAQSAGGAACGPFAFNFVRLLLGSVVLIPAIRFFDGKGNEKKPKTAEDKRLLIKAGIACGLIMGISTNLQQMGLSLGSTAGNAGFLTACYIIIVPLLGLFVKKKCGWNIWVGVLLTLAGLYLLCINGEFKVQLSDIFLIMCAFGFSLHILVIDHFSPLVDGVRLSSIQFAIAGLFSGVLMVIFETGFSAEGWVTTFSAFGNSDAWIPLLYAGVVSCGVGYTLQIIGQNGVNPTLASLLMSLESVFSVLAGWLILGEKMSGREISGCILMFAAIVLAQLPVKTRVSETA